MNDVRKLKSYVWHGDQCFFVSTIERDSSAAVTPRPRFHETIAWEFDWEAKKKGEMVAGAGDGAAFKQHMEVVRQLFCTGKYEEL